MKEGRKESHGKLNYACLPMDALEGVVRVFEKGSVKYGGYRTWLPGIKFSKLFSATMRHLIAWFYYKEDIDKESGEHHLCHACANCLMILTYHNNKKWDDRK